jgi:hypothetical protein
MSKLVKLDRKYWPEGGYGHWCPGCDSGHEINVDFPNSSGAKWSFNGNRYKPTFSPSINMQVNSEGNPHYQPDMESSVCHYFIRDGMIQYLGDCTHALAGKIVELPDLPGHVYLTSERL